jgi:hypothetical protein
MGKGYFTGVRAGLEAAFTQQHRRAQVSQRLTRGVHRRSAAHRESHYV